MLLQDRVASPSLGIALVGAMAKANESKPLHWERLSVFLGQRRERRERRERERERAKERVPSGFIAAAPAKQEALTATHGRAKYESGQVSNIRSGDSAAGSA